LFPDETSKAFDEPFIGKLFGISTVGGVYLSSHERGGIKVALMR
jgi:hypothetical protein